MPFCAPSRHRAGFSTPDTSQPTRTYGRAAKCGWSSSCPPAEAEFSERDWLAAATHNPAFAFPAAEAEDIHAGEDGEPFVRSSSHRPRAVPLRGPDEHHGTPCRSPHRRDRPTAARGEWVRGAKHLRAASATEPAVPERSGGVSEPPPARSAKRGPRARALGRAWRVRREPRCGVRIWNLGAGSCARRCRPESARRRAVRRRCLMAGGGLPR